MKFVAEDGKVFETMEECKEYEEQNMAEMLVGDIPHYVIDADDLFGGSSCNLYVFFRIENSEQDKRFKKWVNRIDSVMKIDDCSFVGKNIIVDCCNDRDSTLRYIDCIYGIETVEEHICNYAKKIMNIVKEI